eukprot:1647622-Rhodomonas_salina.3
MPAPWSACLLSRSCLTRSCLEQHDDLRQLSASGTRQGARTWGPWTWGRGLGGRGLETVDFRLGHLQSSADGKAGHRRISRHLERNLKERGAVWGLGSPEGWRGMGREADGMREKGRETG